MNVHQHAPTCHKGKVGQLRCRMGYPQAIVAHQTRPCQLKLVQKEDGKKAVQSLETIQQWQTTEQRGAHSLAQKDPRIIVLEHHRPLLDLEEDGKQRREEPNEESEATGNSSGRGSVGVNSWVVNFNCFLTGAVGCNTAVYYLGIMEQAKGAVYYMADYLVKSPSELATLLSLAVNTQKRISQFPSILLERMDTTLQQVLGNKAPFGGLGMILMGDFFQLPCIGRPLYSAQASSKAGQLFEAFNVFAFMQQMRAATDEIHSRMLELLRSPSTSGMTEEMFGGLQVLNRRVLEEDPSWRFAPM